jgi:hypothetical protein
MQRKLLLSLLVSLISISQLFASHFMGGEITYVNISPGKYKFYFVFYRDCNGNPVPNTIDLTLRPSYGGSNTTINLTQSIYSIVSNNSPSPCLLPSATFCMNKMIYESTIINIGNATGGYDIYYQPSNLYWSIIGNLFQSTNQSFTISTHMPNPGQFPNNNSPNFNSDPIITFCTSSNLPINYSASDPDGDSLVYLLCSSFTNSPSTPPFNTANYLNPYSGTYPIPSNPTLTINPNTGIINGLPNLNGNWLLKVCVEEYRSGVYLGGISKDVVIITTSCTPSTSYPDVNAGLDTGMCEGDTFQLSGSTATGNVDINWTPANSLSNPNILNPKAFPIVTTNYILTVTDVINGCSRSDTVKIEVDSNNNLTVTANQTICFGSDVTINATGSSIYVWDSTSSLSCLICPSPVASPKTTTMYFVTGFNSSGCIKRDSVLITVRDSIHLNAGNDTIICLGDTISLLATGAYNYLWDFDVSLSCISCPDPLAFPKSSKIYKVTGIDQYGCIETDNIKVQVRNPYIVDAGTDTVICKGDTIQLFGNSNNSNTLFIWSPGNSLSDSNSQYPFAFPFQSTSYILTVTDTFFGCIQYDTINVSTDTFKRFIVTPDQYICNGSSLQINTQGASNYSWLPNTNINCTNCNNPVVSPTISTVYYLTADNQLGCTYTDSIQVGVYDTLIVNSGSDITICYGDTVQLNGSTNSLDPSYQWSPAVFISNTSIHNPDIFTPYSNYYVLNVNDTLTGCLGSDSIFIQVDSFNNLYVSGDTSICNGNSTSLTAAGGVSYSWSPMNALSCINCPNPIANPNQSTLYTVTSLNINGCKNSDSVNVSILSVQANANTQSVCLGDTVQLNANSTSNNLIYAWKPVKDISDSTISNPLAYPTISTQYTLTVTDTILGCQMQDSIDIIVLMLPAISISNDTTLCYGDSIQLTVSGANSYQWNMHPTLSCLSCSNPMAKPTSSTNYFVTGFDLNGCQNTDSILVNLFPSTTVSLSPTFDIICEGTSVQLNSSGGTAYIWQPGNSLNCSQCPNPIASPLTSTVYTVQIIDTNGCNYLLTSEITVIPNQIVNIIPGDTNICKGDSIQLNASIPNPISYLWSPGISLSCSNCPNPSANPLFTTVYTVEITDSFGCKHTGSINLIVDSISNIEGYLQTSQGSNLENTKVYLIRYNPIDSSLSVLDTTFTDTTGYYLFKTEESIVYIKAAPDSNSYPTEMPTYYDSSLVFQNALSVNSVLCDTLIISFKTIFGINPGGPGFIGGFISQGAGKTNGIGDPISGLSLILLDKNNIPVNNTTTNSNGYFSFPGLSIDSFSIIVDKPHILNDNPPGIKLTQSVFIRDSLLFKLNSKRLELINDPSGNKILKSDFATINIIPNPNGGQFILTINFPNTVNENMVMELINSNGKTMDKQLILIHSDHFRKNLNYSMLSNGLYLIRISLKGKVVQSIKWIKN